MILALLLLISQKSTFCEKIKINERRRPSLVSAESSLTPFHECKFGLNRQKQQERETLIVGSFLSTAIAKQEIRLIS